MRQGGGTPAAAEEFCRALRCRQESAFSAPLVDLPRLRHRFGWKFWAMISGGAALDREKEFWHRLGSRCPGHGLTETTSLISLNHPFHTSRGSIGKVLPGAKSSSPTMARFWCAGAASPAATGTGTNCSQWPAEDESLVSHR